MTRSILRRLTWGLDTVHRCSWLGTRRHDLAGELDLQLCTYAGTGVQQSNRILGIIFKFNFNFNFNLTFTLQIEDSLLSELEVSLVYHAYWYRYIVSSNPSRKVPSLLQAAFRADFSLSSSMTRSTASISPASIAPSGAIPLGNSLNAASRPGWKFRISLDNA